MTKKHPDVMSKFLDPLKFLYGEPRKLTKREEQRLEQARELERAALELEIAAEELRAQAAKLEPKNMFPDSIVDNIWKQSLDLSPLPAGEGMTYHMPKFVMPKMAMDEQPT